VVVWQARSGSCRGELLVNLRPLEKRKLALVLTAIRWVYQASAGVWRPEQEGVKLKLTIMRTMLSHLHVYLPNFDPGLAAIFEDRTKAEVSHTPNADRSNQLIDDSEAGRCG
jgi:hypothetical protein